MAYSKSLFTPYKTNSEPSMIHPVGSFREVGSTEVKPEIIAALKVIQEQYTFKMSNKTYERIPTEYPKFLKLYKTIENTYKTTLNYELRTLYLITLEGLQGAINSYSLNYANTELKLERALLQNTTDNLLSGINRVSVMNVPGKYTMNKSFTLAPIFSYYIMVHGMPENGSGFDESKLAILFSIFEKHGINPFQ